MPIRDMPAFVFSHKNVRNSVIYCLITCFVLIAQLVLMRKSAVAIVFDVIIPGTAAVTFGCYAITMAMDRPVILICPPTVYFVSLLINQLIAIEVGVQDTYPFITLIELIPYVFFCISVSTDKLKKVTRRILQVFLVLIPLASLVLLVLAVFFRVMIFSSITHYVRYTIAMIMGLFGVFFTYLTMFELLKISGTDKRVRQKRAVTVNNKN